MGDLAQIMAQNLSGECHFSLCCQCFFTHRFGTGLAQTASSRLEHIPDHRARLHDLFLSGVRIAFHRHLDVRVPRDLLKRLDVDPGGSRHRDVGVPENVRRCVMQVDLPANPLPQAREGALRQGLFSVPENKATFLSGSRMAPSWVSSGIVLLPASLFVFGLLPVRIVEGLNGVRADFLKPQLAEVRQDMVVQQISVGRPRRVP